MTGDIMKRFQYLIGAALAFVLIGAALQFVLTGSANAVDTAGCIVDEMEPRPDDGVTSATAPVTGVWPRSGRDRRNAPPAVPTPLW